MVDDNKITDIFAYFQHTWSLNGFFETTAGIRYDDYSHSGEILESQTWCFDCSNTSQCTKMLYGRAFRAPNGREAFVQVEPDENYNVPYTNGNPNLIAESIDTIETEFLMKPTTNFLSRGSVFFSSVNNRIDKSTGFCQKNHNWALIITTIQEQRLCWEVKYLFVGNQAFFTRRKLFLYTT